MTGCRLHSGERHFLVVRQRMSRRHEHHELVVAEHDRAELRLGRLEGQDAEIERPLRHLRADLPRRNAPDVDVHERMRLAEPRDERQHDMHGRLVGADQHAAAPQVAQVLHGDLRFLGKAQQPLGIVPQQAPGVGERGVFGRPVEQALARRSPRAGGPTG